MAMFHPTRAGTRGGKDQFNWETVKQDKDRECYLGHSVMAPTGRWQEGKDLTWYAKDRENEQQIKTAEFRAAKKLEEEAMMAALGIKVMPPPAAVLPTSRTQSKPTIKHEPQSVRIKDEPMTPAIHNDPRNNSKNYHDQKTNRRKEDRRRKRQFKAAGSDEDKHGWSDDDDLMDSVDTDDDQSAGQKAVPDTEMMTEKELDDFLIDLVKKHGYKTIKSILKPKKSKKERKRKKSASRASSSQSSESDDDDKDKKHSSSHTHHMFTRSLTSSLYSNLFQRSLIFSWQTCLHSTSGSVKKESKPTPSVKERTPMGKLDDNPHPDAEKQPLKRWENNVNPVTGEINGPSGPEPTRYGDWERKGKCVDF